MNSLNILSTRVTSPSKTVHDGPRQYAEVKIDQDDLWRDSGRNGAAGSSNEVPMRRKDLRDTLQPLDCEDSEASSIGGIEVEKQRAGAAFAAGSKQKSLLRGLLHTLNASLCWLLSILAWPGALVWKKLYFKANDQKSIANRAQPWTSTDVSGITKKASHENGEMTGDHKGSQGTHAIEEPPLTVDTIKSPTSPGGKPAVNFEDGPRPPRPLVPRRQPSFSSHIAIRHQVAPKTLVIDLDETLIHSLAKGGRMSSGHMVEVKLNTTVGFGNTTLGPQHPILYYVHKRPYCDEFLRKVCKWFKLVVFTASVQEYADPVIDWLEQEHKFFSERFYRQHCTFRQGAYIKDLSSIESDLQRVMILDNSPLSYSFHEDNAIPIEGWINDPTDNDLLHLVPLLEALQHVVDVRTILSLRRGESSIKS